MLFCRCKEWVTSFEEIMHILEDKRKYTGPSLKFCPYCGKWLEFERNDYVPGVYKYTIYQY